MTMIRNLYLKFRQWQVTRRLLKFEPQMIYHYKHLGAVIPNTRISNSTVINAKETLVLADHVFIGHHNFIEASNGIEIEEGVQITNFISILSHSSHVSIRLYGNAYQQYTNLKGYKKGKVVIGKYSFIGPHSTILPGTKIGKGCLISAYSMLKGDYADFSIIAGNPAVVIGDTRNMDSSYLEENPELLKHYQSWAAQ